MSDFKVSTELRDKLLKVIYDATWYFTCGGYQNEHNSDLSLECHEIESDEVDDVVKFIVLEVLDSYSEKDKLTHQVKRIADSLESLEDIINVKVAG